MDMIFFLVIRENRSCFHLRILDFRFILKKNNNLTPKKIIHGYTT